MDCSTPGFPVHHQLPEPAQTHVHRVGDAIQPSHPLSSPSPPACSPSQHHSLYHWVSSLHQVAKHWSFKFSINPSNEYSGLISFRIDWFDLLAVQGTHKSLLQHHSSKASILWQSAFFIVQNSHAYITTGKTIALIRQTFLGQVKSLLFNMLPSLVIAFLPKSKSLNFMAAVTICCDFGAPQNKICQCFLCFLMYLPWSDGTGSHDLSFLHVVLSQLFHSPLSLSSRGSLFLLCFLP